MGDSNSGASIEFCIEERVWNRLSCEATRQEVTPEKLLNHIVLLFVADRDAGRVARRRVIG